MKRGLPRPTVQWECLTRRELMSFLAGATAAWPYCAWAQRAQTLPRVGTITTSLPSGYEFSSAAVLWLSDFGLLEGRDFLTTRGALSYGDDPAARAAELVQLPVNVIVAQGAAAIRAAMQATTSIPIIMIAEEDPVAAGLVQSLSRPGRNVTGIALLTGDIAYKRTELMKELVPDLHRFGVLMNPEDSERQPELDAITFAAKRLGLEPQILPVRAAHDLQSAITQARDAECRAVMVLPDRQIMWQAHSMAVGSQLPMIFPIRWYVDRFAGPGLISYGPNSVELGRRIASFIARTLKGANPAELPIEQPTSVELVVNLKLAKAIGFNVPETILARADELIE